MFLSFYVFGNAPLFLWGLLYGTDLISVNSCCDVIFSLMRKLYYAQYINYNKNNCCKVTWWWSGSAYCGRWFSSNANFLFLVF